MKKLTVRYLLIPFFNIRGEPIISTVENALNCFIEHITNNYFNKFSQIEKNNYNDLRGVCKLDIEDVCIDKQNQKHFKNNFDLINFKKIILWKFRFLIKIFRK